MDPDRLRGLASPVLASLFMVLSLCAFVIQRPVSTGLHIPLPMVRVVPSPLDCYDERSLLVRARNDGSTWINETQIRPDEVGFKFAKIMEYRSGKPPVYILTDDAVSYERFANLFNSISTSAEGLHIGVITPQVDNELRQCPLGSICGLDLPGSCLYFNFLPVRVPRNVKP